MYLKPSSNVRDQKQLTSVERSKRIYLLLYNFLQLQNVLTNAVANSKPVLRSPVVVDFAVVSRRNNPSFGVTNLKLEGPHREVMEGREDGQ